MHMCTSDESWSQMEPDRYVKKTQTTISLEVNQQVRFHCILGSPFLLGARHEPTHGTLPQVKNKMK